MMESKTRRARTDANRLSVNRYYVRNSHDIIKQKTLRLARERGRVPRDSTIAKHGLDREMLHGLLQEYATKNPESRAARKVQRFTLLPSTQGAIAE